MCSLHSLDNFLQYHVPILFATVLRVTVIFFNVVLNFFILVYNDTHRVRRTHEMRVHTESEVESLG